MTTTRTFSALGLTVLFALQAQAQPRPEFEVASVKLTDGATESYMPTLDIAPGGSLRISNRRLNEIIMLAYGVGAKQLVGPEWLISNDASPSHFEILAKIPEDAKKGTVPLMLQKLLEDRFHLKAHRDARASTVYALELGKGPLGLQPSTPNPQRTPGCKRSITGGSAGASADCYRVTSAQLAQQLQSLAPGVFRDGPVVDRTNLTGTYDLSLSWMMQGDLDAGMAGPTMFTAVDKLGLHLNKLKDSAETLIIDHCEQVPTEN